MQVLRPQLAVLVAAVASLAACGSAVPSPKAHRLLPATHPLAPRPVLVAPSAVSTDPGPGALPQTPALPSATTQSFKTSVADLWAAIVTDNPALAMPAFFPLPAYLQVKSLTDDAHDWAVRLVAHFVLDIEAAHAVVTSHGGTPTLVGLEVPTTNANWVPPGTCYNRLGYWHVPGSRLVYQVGTTTYSIGVLSLISWRGTWYVVHLGAINRPSDEGAVDAPAVGVGSFGPPGGC
ncbi:hypothetical protein Afer_1069 [Acidimicrobium ferrooxidans DSM 10331]|uniref:Lipoprotein n=2 Tax=Acidimicrobium ferrooxidans TaxID=53635 RepID=C7LZ46_ACIFD|nr:hypothetical protein Afer_1069 [Acidimicrobium ferrooxidans DSM 10331]